MRELIISRHRLQIVDQGLPVTRILAVILDVAAVLAAVRPQLRTVRGRLHSRHVFHLEIKLFHAVDRPLLRIPARERIILTIEEIVIAVIGALPGCLAGNQVNGGEAVISVDLYVLGTDIAENDRIGDRQLGGVAVNPAAALILTADILGNGGVQDDESTVFRINRAAFSVGLVSGKRGVRHHHLAVAVPDGAAAGVAPVGIGQIPGKRGVVDYQSARVVNRPAAALGRLIADKGGIVYHQISGIVNRPAAALAADPVPGKRGVGHRQIPRVDNRAANPFRIPSALKSQAVEEYIIAGGDFQEANARIGPAAVNGDFAPAVDGQRVLLNKRPRGDGQASELAVNLDGAARQRIRESDRTGIIRRFRSRRGVGQRFAETDYAVVGIHHILIGGDGERRRFLEHGNRPGAVIRGRIMVQPRSADLVVLELRRGQCDRADVLPAGHDPVVILQDSAVHPQFRACCGGRCTVFQLEIVLRYTVDFRGGNQRLIAEKLFRRHIEVISRTFREESLHCPDEGIVTVGLAVCVQIIEAAVADEDGVHQIESAGAVNRPAAGGGFVPEKRRARRRQRSGVVNRAAVAGGLVLKECRVRRRQRSGIVNDSALRRKILLEDRVVYGQRTCRRVVNDAPVLPGHIAVGVDIFHDQRSGIVNRAAVDAGRVIAESGIGDRQRPGIVNRAAVVRSGIGAERHAVNGQTARVADRAAILGETVRQSKDVHQDRIVPFEDEEPRQPAAGDGNFAVAVDDQGIIRRKAPFFHRQCSERGIKHDDGTAEQIREVNRITAVERPGPRRGISQRFAETDPAVVRIHKVQLGVDRERRRFPEHGNRADAVLRGGIVHHPRPADLVVLHQFRSQRGDAEVHPARVFHIVILQLTAVLIHLQFRACAGDLDIRCIPDLEIALGDPVDHPGQGFFGGENLVGLNIGIRVPFGHERADRISISRANGGDCAVALDIGPDRRGKVADNDVVDQVHRPAPDENPASAAISDVPGQGGTGHRQLELRVAVEVDRPAGVVRLISVKGGIHHRQHPVAVNRPADAGQISGKGGVRDHQRPGVVNRPASAAVRRIPGERSAGHGQISRVDDRAAIAVAMTVLKGHAVEENVIAGRDFQNMGIFAAVEGDPSAALNGQRSILRKQRRINAQSSERAVERDGDVRAERIRESDRVTAVCRRESHRGIGQRFAQADQAVTGVRHILIGGDGERRTLLNRAGTVLQKRIRRQTVPPDLVVLKLRRGQRDHADGLPLAVV